MKTATILKFTEQLCLAHDLNRGHAPADGAERVSRDDVLEYIEAHSIAKPPSHPTTALHWDLIRTFGESEGRRLLLQASRRWDAKPLRARDIVFKWTILEDDYEPQAWVDEYLLDVIRDWRTEVECKLAAEDRRLEQAQNDAVKAVKADQRVMRAAAEDEWLAFNGAATQQQVDAWKKKFAPLYLPFERKLAPVTIIPFPAQPAPVLPAAPLPRLIKTSAEFIAGYVPPEYLIDGILQRRYIYSVTAKTGAGKTSIALRWTGHVVTGSSLGEKEVERGKVLYFAGENPDDVRARWFVLCREMNIEPGTDMVQWIDGAMDLTQVAERICSEIAENGNEYALVVVDTAAAYFPGDDENSNTQAGNHARHLRSMTTLPGGPCTLVLCHPTKRAADDDLQPRGGGAFIAEMDGNIAVCKKEMLVTAAPFGKFRGDNSWSMKFELDIIKDHPTLKDAKGRFTTSVLARPVAEGAAAVLETRADSDTIAVLNAVFDAPGSTPSDIARTLAWTFGSKAQPNINRVKRNLDRLLKDKAVKETLGRWKATAIGQQALNDADRAKAAQPKPMFPLPPLPTR